jgi:hypothetical protein
MDHLYALSHTTNECCCAVTCDRAGSYVCWCPDKHPVFVRKPSGKDGVRVITAHFAHFHSGGCRKGGESVEHVNAKMALQTMAGKFSFVMTTCPECDKETVEDCGNGTVVLELRSDDRRWRYDAVYTDVHGLATALEVYHSHAATDEKIQCTRSKGMRIAEFSADDILQLAENGEGGRLKNLAMQTELCSLFCKNRVIMMRRERLEREMEVEQKKRMERGLLEEICRKKGADRIRQEEEERAFQLKQEEEERAFQLKREEEERAL